MNKKIFFATITVIVTIAVLTIAVLTAYVLTSRTPTQPAGKTIVKQPLVPGEPLATPTIILTTPSPKPLAKRFSTPPECVENDFCSRDCLCALEAKYCNSSHSLGCAAADFMQCACFNAEKTRAEFGYNDSKAVWLQNYAVYYNERWVNIPVKRQCFNNTEVYNVIIFSSNFYKFKKNKKPC